MTRIQRHIRRATPWLVAGLIAAALAPAGAAAASGAVTLEAGGADPGNTATGGTAPGSGGTTTIDTADLLRGQSLRLGDAGAEVSALQRALKLAGYTLKRTGVFDAPTQGALKRFQRTHHLAGSGVATKKTIKALIAVVKDESEIQDAIATWPFPLAPVKRVAPISYWSNDQGVDISFLGGQCGRSTSELAVADGTIVAVGIGGFGSQSPVMRIDSGPFRGRYVYYGHAQPALVRKGQKVSAGQPIARVGCGIVGISSAPHIEFGISESGASSPCCPGWGVTAPMVRRILEATYKRALHRGR
jgi:murein DD-endopeptidase MepM/ murein hydrolase activator NlpD